jgi:hypothetical protein
MRVRSRDAGRRRSAGFTFLEVTVAFTLLGIGLAGIGPLVVMQLRLSKKIEQGFNPQTAYFKPGSTFYLVPRSDSWSRKLGVGASLQTSSSSGGTTSGTPTYTVTVVGPVQKALGSDVVSVVVSLTKVTTGGSQ